MGASKSSDGESLPTRVAEWLDSQGYPLELRVATSMRECDAAVYQSEYYIDPEDHETNREIDLMASWSKNPGGGRYSALQITTNTGN